MTVRLFLSALVAVGLLALACSRPAEPAPSVSETRAQVASAALTPAAAPAALGPVAAGAPSARSAREKADEAQFTPPPRPPSDHAKIIAASQILISYRGALKAPPQVTRSKEDARELSIQVSRLARAGADFGGLALKYSDDPSVRQNLGNLGKIKRDQMEKPFSDVAFNLLVMEVTELPVETALGFHIIRRTE